MPESEWHLWVYRKILASVWSQCFVSAIKLMWIQSDL